MGCYGDYEGRATLRSGTAVREVVASRSGCVKLSEVTPIELTAQKRHD